ncbi:MAG: dTDP-4-dehydrorhamnose reductase [Candidatus Sumerlaeia bacterium]|nr:dTDP-4-dehydrorhamnose reductase [Candidatus Sumerlaeia bacterium]
MKTILVTGANGMLGSDVLRRLQREAGVRVVPSTADDMDITDLEAVRDCMHRHRPTHVVHCAAYTAVDSAEREPLRAYMVNAEGTKNLAFFCRELDAELLYVSTDYVFSGAKGSPYREDDATGPINTYGKSKLLGERYAAVLCERHKVIRTSWLNGLGGVVRRNFIETMLRLAETRPQLSVVDDQFGRPTFTFDLAEAIATLLSVNSYGVFHVSNGGQCSWYEFALRIFECAGKQVDVRPIPGEQFRSLARRPANSAMENTRFPAMGLAPLPRWEDSLREYFRLRRVYLQEERGRDEGSPAGEPATAPSAGEGAAE